MNNSNMLYDIKAKMTQMESDLETIKKLVYEMHISMACAKDSNDKAKKQVAELCEEMHIQRRIKSIL